MAEDKDLNRDPLSDEPGSHPVGTGVGAAGGAIAGAAAGVVGGPVGMAVGGVVGALVGGLAGKAAAEAVNPTAEEAYWRENYSTQPYYEPGRSFDDYGPAYLHGLEARGRYDNWDTAEPYLASEWETRRGGSSLSWKDAHPASRAAWDRVDPHYRVPTGGSTGDANVVSDGKLSHYGTGMVSSDSSYRTGGAGVTEDDKASWEGRHPRTEPHDASRSETTHMQSTDMGTTNAGSGWGSMGATSTMTGGTVGATTGMDANYTAGTTTSVGSPGANADRDVSARTGDMDKGGRKDTINVLQKLVETCKDGEYGFDQCAQRTSRADLKTLFNDRAEDCRRGARQLEEQLRQLGGKVDAAGSAMGSIHRGWVSLRTAMSKHDDKVLLEEAERGEDNALARYRKALQKPLPDPVRQIVQHQCDRVQQNHDQIKRLRDQVRAQS